jgi:hypothetical protein
MKSTFTFLGAAAAAASRARTEGFLMRLGARSSLFSSMSKSDSDNPLFREEAAEGGVGERERTERGEEDMVMVIVRNGFEDCSAEMFEMLILEDMKTKKQGKRRSF